MPDSTVCRKGPWSLGSNPCWQQHLQVWVPGRGHTPTPCRRHSQNPELFYVLYSHTCTFAQHSIPLMKLDRVFVPILLGLNPENLNPHQQDKPLKSQSLALLPTASFGDWFPFSFFLHDHQDFCLPPTEECILGTWGACSMCRYRPTILWHSGLTLILNASHQ